MTRTLLDQGRESRHHVTDPAVYAQNLRDSGVMRRSARSKGARRGRRLAKAAQGREVAKAVQECRRGHDAVLTENIPAVYYKRRQSRTPPGATLAFAHGFNIHYNQVVPRADLTLSWC